MKVNTSESAAQREARLSETEAELSRTKAACARFSQVILMVLIPTIFWVLSGG